MIKAETLELVRTRFNEQENRFGYTNATAVATAIAPDNQAIASVIKRSVTRMPTKDFLYDGAYETVQELIDTGDRVVVWTQGDPTGQLFKVARSGLGDVRKTLPAAERSRFGVHASIDKITALPDYLASLVKNGTDTIVIVDDKAKNIVAVAEAVKKAKSGGQLPEHIEVTPVWINQGRTKDQVPQDYTLDSFTKAFKTIDDISELKKLKGEKKTTWLLDFDHTLTNTSQAKEALFKQIGKQIDIHSHEPIVNYRVDTFFGLNGNVKKVEQLKSGMSGGRVTKVTTDTSTLVVKHNPDEPHKVNHEIDGYKKLSSTPLAAHLPAVAGFYSKESTAILIDYIDGVQLREGIKTGDVSAPIAKSVLEKLLTLKQQWWSSQEKQPRGREFVSMQRGEWQDTLTNLPKTLDWLSAHFGISKEHLCTDPMVVEGKELPPLLHVIKKVSGLLKESPPYTLLAHNDATGANIIVETKTGEFTLIDTEWTGHADPAESYVRMIKYLSTTTAQSFDTAHITQEQNQLQMYVDVAFSPAAVSLQRLGMEKLSKFSKALGDPEFAERAKIYLAGSYLREMALALKRGMNELSLFAMIKASEAVTL